MAAVCHGPNLLKNLIVFRLATSLVRVQCALPTVMTAPLRWNFSTSYVRLFAGKPSRVTAGRDTVQVTYSHLTKVALTKRRQF